MSLFNNISTNGNPFQMRDDFMTAISEDALKPTERYVNICIYSYYFLIFPFLFLLK